MPIKSFRGTIVDGGEEMIPLSTNKGLVGYRIKKFEVMTTTFQNAELIVRIWKVSGLAQDQGIDFADNRLLAAIMYASPAAAETNPADSQTVIFDNEIFNQDIYVTNYGVSSPQTMNYYIELEQIKLDINESTVTTLKDIRNINS
jgi:hypothetical protein